ncbi:Trans-resveratrol di-O-methyltransferase [Dichanthelium oligosanthes]|uniref:Trans-resveratrol di-O-methyltransferase n=1 Tax=Dichanthelium oligosanthes TaxID=888268 RepID=A0A1E5UV08_9POAL|nr:Trans-resveratrol di-O-methyltransferase [Dichanthelium oligosanthes]
MRFLATSGIFVEVTPVDGDAKGPCYRLTTASRLLVDDDDAGGGHTCLSQLVVLVTSPFYFAASQSLADWLKKEDGAVAAAAETPFMVAHGEGLYDFLTHDAAFSACFDKAMGSDSRFMAGIVVRECTEVLAGVTSLVDVGGGDGTTARAIAKAFPHVRCSVLELPRVVDAAPADGTVEFVAGDMMELIPPADAVLFKDLSHVLLSDCNFVKTF